MSPGTRHCAVGRGGASRFGDFFFDDDVAAAAAAAQVRRHVAPDDLAVDGRLGDEVDRRPFSWSRRFSACTRSDGRSVSATGRRCSIRFSTWTSPMTPNGNERAVISDSASGNASTCRYVGGSVVGEPEAADAVVRGEALAVDLDVVERALVVGQLGRAAGQRHRHAPANALTYEPSRPGASLMRRAAAGRRRG